MVIKKRICPLILLVGIFLGGHANADESDLELTDLAIIEGAMAFGFLVVSDNPNEWGNFMIALSPFVAAIGVEETEHPVATYLLGVAALAGYGNWLKNQEDEKQSETFKKQFLVFNAIMLPVWAYDMASDKDGSAEPSQFFLEADPITQSAKLTYEIKF